MKRRVILNRSRRPAPRARARALPQSRAGAVLLLLTALAAVLAVRPLFAAGPNAWRAVPPPLRAAPALTVPQISEARLENGLTVRAIERPHLPLASVGLAFRGGSAADPEGREGLASVTWDLLLDDARRFADLGTEPEVEVDADGVRWQVRVMAEDVPEVLERLAAALAAPAPDAGELRRAVRSAAVRARRDDGRLAEALFGEASPYGRPVHGTAAGRAALTTEDVQAFRKRYAVPAGAALIVAGPVTLNDLVGAARTHLGGWEGGPAPKTAVARAGATSGGIHRLPGYGGSAELELGLPLVPAGDDEEAALRVATRALHGRLGTRLRTRTGYAYRVTTEPLFSRGGGLIRAEASVDLDRTEDALAQIRLAVRDLPGIVDDGNVDFYRRATLEELAEAYDTAAGAVENACRGFVQELPADYAERLAEAVRAVDADDVRRAVDRHLGKDRLHVLVRGRRVASR